jgi:hypothetical protein
VASDLGQLRMGMASRDQGRFVFSLRGAGGARIGKTMSDNTEVLNYLRQLDAKIDALGIKMDQIDQEHGRALDLLRQDMTLLRQDVAGIRVTLGGHTTTLRDRLQDMRILRAAIFEMAKEKITPGEIEILHEDMSKLQIEVSELKSRLEVVEAQNQN